MTDWQTQALEDLRTTTLSRAEVAAKYHRSPAAIQKLMRLHDVIRPLRPKDGPRKLATAKPLSNQHRWIGLKLYNCDPEGKLGKKIGVSQYAYAAMRAGVHDFTMSQILVICEHLQMDILELLAPPESLSRKAG